MSSWQRPLALTAAAAMLLVAAGYLGPGSPKAQTSKPVTVTEVARSCPVHVNPTALASGRVVAHPDTVTNAIEMPGEARIEALSQPDGWASTTVNKSILRAVEFRDRDDEGAGFVAFAAAKGTGKTGGGFAITECPGARSESWFVGAGSSTRHLSTLVLTNLGDTPAIADVAMVGANGIVEVVDGEGIVLEANTSRRIPLDDIAAGEAELAVRVNSRRGALTATMRDTSTAVFKGSEWIAPTNAPARVQTITGLPSGASGRELIVVNPGDVSAEVGIEVLGKEGTIVADQFEEVTVRAGSVNTFSVPATAGSEAVSLRLRSSQDIAASVRVASSDKDFAYGVSSEEVAGPAVIPLSMDATLAAMKPTLLLVAGRASSPVRVEAFDADMTNQGSIEIDVPADRTFALDLAKKGLFDSALGDLAYVVMTPALPVWGAVAFTAETTISILPLTAAPLTVLAPHVQPGR